MACKYVIEDKDGNKVLDDQGNQISVPLFEQLVKHFKSEKFSEDESLSKAEEIFEYIDGPQYMSEYGDYKRRQYNNSTFPVDEDGNLKIDKYGYPLMEDVLEQFSLFKLKDKRWNYGEATPVANMAQRKLLDFINAIEAQLRVLNEKKGNLLEKGRLRELSRQYFEAIQAAKESQVYIKLAEEAMKTLEGLKIDIRKDTLSFRDLVNLGKIVKKYEKISEIRNLIRQTKSITNQEIFPEHIFLDITDKELEQLLKGLDEVSKSISEINAVYREKAIGVLTLKIFGLGEEYLARMRDFYSENYRLMAANTRKRSLLKTLEAVFVSPEDEDYNKKMDEYVEKRMAESADLNEEQRKRYIIQNLFMGQDIDVFQRWFVDLAGLKDSGARAIGNLLFYAEEDSRIRAEAWKEKAQPYYEAYVKHMKSLGIEQRNVGPLQFWNLIAERQYNEDGTLGKTGTGYYVHQFHSNWTEDLEKIFNKKRELKKEADEKGWIDKYFGGISDDVVEEELKKGNNRPEEIQEALILLDTLTEYNTSFNSANEDLKNWYEQIDVEKKKNKEINKMIGRLVKNLKRGNPSDEQVVEIESLINELRLDKEENQSEIRRLSSSIKREIIRLESIPIIPAINKDTGNLVAIEEKQELQELGLELNTTNNYKSLQYQELKKLLKNDISDPIVSYYRKVVMPSLQEADKLLPDSGALFYRMLGIRKQKLERIEEFSRDVAHSDENRFQKIWRYTKEMYNDMFKYQEGKDVESGHQRLELEKGEEFNLDFAPKIPIFFRKQLPPEDQSWNVHGNLLTGVNIAYKYQQMSEIEPVLELYMSLIKDKQMVQNFQKFVEGFTKDHKFKRTVKSKGEKSNIYDVLSDIIAARMYGEVIKETGLKIGEVPVRKLLSMWLQYIGYTLLGANPYSATQNFILGNTLTYLESLYGEHISSKSFRTGQNFYWARGIIGTNLSKKSFEKSLLGDIGRSYAKNIVARIGIKFDAQNDFSVVGENDIYAYSNAFKSLIETDILLAGQFLGEHQMHHVTLLSVLAEIKVLNENGEYLSKEGKGISKTRAGARSLLKSYSMGDFSLDLFKEVAFIEIRTGESYRKLPLYGKLGTNPKEVKIKEGLNRNTEIQISSLVKDINKKLHGAYAAENAAAAKRYPLGQVLLSMRRFMPPGVNRRIGGLGAFTYLGLKMLFKGEGLSEIYRDKRKNNKVRSSAARDSFFKDMQDPSGINTSTKIYNPRTGVVEESMYVTTLKFLAYSGWSMKQNIQDMFRGIKASGDAKVAFIAGHTRREWQALSMHERANIVRSGSELLLGMFLYYISGFLKELAEEDEDDIFKYHLAFFTHRLYQELTMYANPKTLSDILQSPATSSSMLERWYKLFAQGIEDISSGEIERYQRGLRKYDTKIGRRFTDVLPAVKQVKRYKYIEDVISNMYRED